jgi:hypothetical protein
MRYNWGMTTSEENTSMANLTQKLVAAKEVNIGSAWAVFSDIAAKVTGWKNYAKVLWILSAPVSAATEQWLTTNHQVNTLIPAANDLKFEQPRQEELKKAA